MHRGREGVNDLCRFTRVSSSCHRPRKAQTSEAPNAREAGGSKGIFLIWSPDPNLPTQEPGVAVIETLHQKRGKLDRPMHCSGQPGGGGISTWPMVLSQTHSTQGVPSIPPDTQESESRGQAEQLPGLCRAQV